MDATAMPSTVMDNLAAFIEAFPEFTFVEHDEFRWMPSQKTIEYSLDDPHASERLLHEIAHAKLGHTSYGRDVELITLERDAWHYAKTVLAPMFTMTISADSIEDDLDTYRDWLHARSTCPACQATGLQTGAATYTCVACHTKWDVNTATHCGLRRYIQKTPR